MDNYLLPDWQDKSKSEKILTILSIVFAIIIAISIIVTLITKHNLYYIYYTFIFLFLVTQGIEYWKYNKPIAITEFICSVIFLVADIIMIVKK